jgi:CDP-diacylglycerol--serine O-phosphatidyltransferase
LRRSGTLARQVLLVRVGRSRRDSSGSTIVRHDNSGSARLAPLSGSLGDLDAEPSNPPGFTVHRAGYAVETIRPISPAFPELTEPAPPAAGPRTIPLLPGEHTLTRQLAFAAVNACTLASLVLGVFAILLAMRADVRAAALCLIACVIFDGLDGALARRLGVSSPFGAQMDSLADMCSFGLAAPIVAYASLSGTVSTLAAGATCAMVAGCSAIRLARFNVSPKDGRFFCGVPTTMAAAVLALTVLIDLPVAGRFQLAGVALLGFAMVSSFPYAKLARLIKLPPWLWLAPISGALVDVRLTFASVVICYLLSGPVLWLHHRRTA